MMFHHVECNLDHKVEYLHCTDEGEACEEPHGASYSRQLVHKLGCSVLKRNERVLELQS